VLRVYDRCLRFTAAGGDEPGPIRHVRIYANDEHEVRTLPLALQQAPAFTRTMIADPGEHTHHIAGVVRGLAAGSTLLALIGPEGGWTDE